jgi:formylglycine-generating enzyme required for sulfatase activity
MGVFAELRRRNVFKVGAAYLVVAWLLIQIAVNIEKPLHLPDWFDTAIIVLLAIGFPVALVIAWAFELTPEGIKPSRTFDPAQSAAATPVRGLSLIAIGVAIGAAAGAGTLWFLTRDTDAQWLRNEAIPAIETFVDQDDYESAYALAKQAEARVPGDPDLAALWPTFSWLVTIPSDPAGATVYRRSYADGDAANGASREWETLGVTPLENVRVPFGLSRLRFKLDGYEPMDRLLGGGGIADKVLVSNIVNVGPDSFRLDRAGTLPEGQVRVPGWTESVAGQETAFDDFFMDRYEVTNRDYKAFVDAGGYTRREYWVEPIMLDGRELPFDDAMKRFIDKTGRPGPSTWEAGDYPRGQDEYPVTGVSWYEAAAYARFANGELPTLYHWRRAYSPGLLTWLLRASNVEGDGPAPVGKFPGMSWPGTYDMVGNAREWIYNATGNDRFMLGGGWNDLAYTPTNLVYSQPPLDRGATNGFRLMRTQEPAQIARRSREPLPVAEVRDVLAEKPVPAEVLRAYETIFAYDPTPLDARVEATVTTRSWTRERVSFATAYGDGRMAAYLFLPTTGQPPFKTVVYWPGSNALGHKTIDEYPEVHIDFVVKSGRAVVFPVLDGTFERGDRGPQPDISTTAHRDVMVRRIKDLRRTVDYLETRTEFEMSTLAYYGLSWGGWNAPTALAVEPRFKSAVLYAAYIVPLTGSVWSSRVPGGRMLPEIDPVTYLPSVHVPTLMLNGEFDNLGPLETSVKPFFALLGTPAEDKKHVISPGGHFVPRDVLIRETLDWLDKYQGVPGS